MVIRSASYTTDSWHLDNHMASVRRVVPLAMPSQDITSGLDLLSLSSVGGSNKTTFQMASLDDFGGVVIWTVIELKEVRNA
jgi:hypothetical protein